MNKSDLIKLLAEKTGFGKKNIDDVFNLLISTIVKDIKDGHKVKIKGFGVFRPVRLTKRPVRNPKTGEKLDLVPRNTFKFKPGDDVVRDLNK